MAPFLWKISTPRVAQASLYALVHSNGALKIISDRLRIFSFHLSSCVCWYHVYKDVWTTSAGAVLQGEQESKNSQDPYVVAVQTDCGTHSMHHILPLLHVCSAQWLNNMHDYWSKKALHRFATGRSGIALHLHLQWS